MIRALGFGGAYFLPLEGYASFPNQFSPPRLCLDPLAEYPWATAIMVLVYPYTPFHPDTYLPGYYIASNAGYHLSNKLCTSINALGYRAERFEPHIKALLSHNGVGRQLRNSLIALPGFGTRTALFAIATNCAKEQEYAQTDISDCGNCELCQNACPFNAISKRGLDPKLCARAHMESADMPEHIRKGLPGLLGCERCQAVCPKNKQIGFREPTDEERAAFDLTMLASGEVKQAKLLVGKNMCTKGRLKAQAAALLKIKEGKYDFRAYTIP